MYIELKYSGSGGKNKMAMITFRCLVMVYAFIEGAGQSRLNLISFFFYYYI